MNLNPLKTLCLFTLLILQSVATFGTIIEITPVQGGFSRNSNQFRYFEWDYNSLIQTLDSSGQNLTIKLGTESKTYSEITNNSCNTFRVVRMTSSGNITSEITGNFYSGVFRDTILNITHMFYIGIFEDQIYCRFEGFSNGDISILGQSIQQEEFGYIILPPSNEPFEVNECGYVGDEEYEEFDSELEPYKCNSDSDSFPDFNYTPDKILELGVATDYDFYAAHIDYLDVIAHIHAVVNSGRYELVQSLGIYVCIVAIGIREYPGPAFNGENEFHKYAFIPCANYDMCGLITGKNVFPCGSTTGRRGPNCGGNELDWDGGRFYSKKGANMSRTGQTFYHELGHCLGLGHTPDSCLGRCSSNEPYIMCPAGCGTERQGHFYDWGSIKNARFRIEKNLYPCLDEPVQQPCLDCSRTYMQIIPELNHVSPPCTSDTLDVTFKLKVDCMGQSFDSIFIRIPKTFFEIIDYDDAAWQYSQSQFNHVFYKPNVGLPPYDSLIHTIRIKAIQDNEHIPVSFNTEYDEVTKLITSKVGVATFIQGPVSLADLLTQEPNLLNESRFHINGVLAWDVNDLDIENKIFIFDQNSGIKIQTGLKVNFKSSNFIGCDYLWNGIELEPNCSFNSFSCKFEDAINAVKITEGNGRHSFKNTIFENNYNGILCHPSPNQSEGKFHFNPDFSGNVFRSNRSLKPISEILSYPLKPIAGITISNASNNVMLTSVGAFQYSRNRFENLENGILAIRSDLALFGGFYFEGIHYNEESTLLSGNAIFSSGKGHVLYISNVNQNKTNIKNCHVGIFSENNNFNGHEIDMTAVNYGCISDRSIGKRFVLSQSKISALNHCILLNQCHNGSGAIYSNTLETVGKDDPENISSAISVLDAGTTSNWRIYNNTIVSMNSSQGIALHNVRNSNILNNHISKTSLVPGSKYSGILLSNSSFNIVNCNHIHAPSSEKYTGLFLLQSTFNKVECNSIFGSMDTHLFTEGDCSSTFLKGNNFYSNPLMNNSSIIVNDFSRIGLQPFHGNQFHSFQDLWNKDNDEFEISRSRFSIGEHPAQPIPAILAAGWIYTPPVLDDEEIFVRYQFDILNYECPQNEENCVPSLYEELPIDLFSKSVIDQHEVSWGDYTSTMSPTSARRLMHDILYHKPTGFDSDTTITSFLDSMSYTNIGAFQSRLLELDSIGQIYGDQIAAKLIACDSVYTLAHAFLSSKDSLEVSQTDQDTLLSIMNGIDTLNVLLGSTLTDAAQDYTYFRQYNLATYSLNGLSDQDSILGIAYRKLFADMVDTIGLFNRLVQYTNITLTDSCYLEYGDGVFILRGLKSVYGNNWHYFRNCSVPQPQSKGIDGDAFNSAPGISRQQTENTGHGLIRVYPNPASDEIIIDMQDLPGMTSISGNVTLMHMNGTVLHSRHLASAITHAIDVSSLAAGMYMLCISKDSDPVGKYFKIFILR